MPAELVEAKSAKQEEKTSSENIPLTPTNNTTSATITVSRNVKRNSGT